MDELRDEINRMIEEKRDNNGEYLLTSHGSIYCVIFVPKKRALDNFSNEGFLFPKVSEYSFLQLNYDDAIAIRRKLKEYHIRKTNPPIKAAR